LGDQEGREGGFVGILTTVVVTPLLTSFLKGGYFNFGGGAEAKTLVVLQKTKIL
jgi:hypothetical protein